MPNMYSIGACGVSPLISMAGCMAVQGDIYLFVMMVNRQGPSVEVTNSSRSEVWCTPKWSVDRLRLRSLTMY
eukprot:9504145-Pyramimonas_sp.AAC.1